MGKGLTTRHSFMFSPMNVVIGFVVYLSILTAMLMWPKFFTCLQYIGFIFSAALLYLFFANKSRGKPITKTSATIQQRLLIMLLQMFLILFYFVTLELAIFCLPHPELADSQFIAKAVDMLFHLQPWSLSSLIGFLLARQFSQQTDSYPKISDYIKPLFNQQIPQRLAYFIEFFISRVFSLAFTLIFCLTIVCAALFCCQRLNINILYGFNLETFFLCSLLLSPISHTIFGKLLRFANAKQYPVSFYYGFFTIFFITTIILFSLLSHLAHHFIPHLIPPLAHANFSLLKREYGLYYFLLGANISLSFLMGSYLMRLAKGLSYRQFISASFLWPSLLMLAIYMCKNYLKFSHYLTNPLIFQVSLGILLLVFISVMISLSHTKDSRYLGLGFAKHHESHEFLKPIIYMRSRFLTMSLNISLLLLAQYNLFGLLALLSVIPAILIMTFTLLLRCHRLA